MKPMKFLILCFVVILLTLGVSPYAKSNPAPTHTQSDHWSYSGEVDPNHWGDLSSEFATCKTGNQQSPINIEETKGAKLATIEFNYKNTPFKVINNGHTIEVEYEPGSSIKLDGKRYELRQFHFHDPSEHTVDGKISPMEAHLVHKSKNGKLAVIGIFLKEGQQNDFIQTLWANIPVEKGEKTVKGVSINVSALTPTDKSYYHYFGSLTTPPCSEGVNWNVLKTPVEISPEQIAKFTSVYSGNVRPVQPLNRRVIEVKNF